MAAAWLNTVNKWLLTGSGVAFLFLSSLAVPQQSRLTPIAKQTKVDSLRLVQLRFEQKQLNRAKAHFRKDHFAQAFSLLKKYRRSAAFDDLASLYLGKCYSVKLGNRQPNYSLAVRSFTLVHPKRPLGPKAAYALSQLYLSGGYGLKADVQKATHYFRRAEKGGEVQAAFYLGQIYLNGTGGIAQNDSLGIHYLTKAAEKGLTDAQWALGLLYTQGTPNTPKDLKQAKYWYRKVADSRQAVLSKSL